MRLKASICCTLTIALLALGAPAWAAKVKVCHVPPGNPANFHTITIDDNAVQAHLAHGDLLGSCAAHCDQLCDDGNACTIDACDANEHCLLNHPPVNCDDSSLCTIDTCDPASGCKSTPKVCQDSNLCTVNTCDPLTGNCAFPPVACPAGQACNASNGSCETTASACPCVDRLAGWSDALNGPIQTCTTQTSTDPVGEGVLLFPSGLISSSFPEGGLCGFYPGGPLAVITEQQAKACNDLLKARAAAASVTCQEQGGGST
ncbi:MAG TPA: hypothetical protein VGM86_12000 [Thermoanaerobaculia bacterium]